MSKAQLEAQVASLETNLNTLKVETGKFLSGNKSSAARARKAALEIKNLAHQLRLTVSEIKEQL